MERIAPRCRTARRLAPLVLLPGVNNHRIEKDLTTNDGPEFYREEKWCDACRGYVRFLMSINHSYCITCGGRVRLFNRNDSRNFQETVQRHKWQAS
jgi:hypothetical protein